MTLAKPKQQSDRRTAILDAAERCFAQSGFHQASMHDICLAAGMSPGNLYRYFASKEAIIAGIAERNRAVAADSFAAVASAPSFLEGLSGLARYHMIDSSDETIGLCVEIMAESRRNPAIARLFHGIEDDIKQRLIGLLRSAAGRGEISAAIDFEAAATMLMVLGDGISWRRVSDRSFNAERALPIMFQMVGSMLGIPQGADRTVSEVTP